MLTGLNSGEFLFYTPTKVAHISPYVEEIKKRDLNKISYFSPFIVEIRK